MSRSILRSSVFCATCLLTLASGSLLAQNADPLNRLDSNSRFAVEALLDSARQIHMPTRPLLSKAYEGVSKHAEPRRVVVAVRSLYASMKKARTVLGPSLTETEWSAAAAALQAGVSGDLLAHFRSTTPSREKPLARALVVLADLITRGVPVDTASSAIIQLWQRGAVDADFYGLWRDVERDILSGANPGAALQQRTREFPDHPGALPQPSARPPETPSL